MSQNSINLTGPSGHPVRVTVGFDRPLSEIFSNVLPIKDDDPTDYSSVVLASFPTVDELAATFEALKMPLPSALLDTVRLDETFGAGNVVRTFDAHGTLIEQVVF